MFLSFSEYQFMNISEISPSSTETAESTYFSGGGIIHHRNAFNRALPLLVECRNFNYAVRGMWADKIHLPGMPCI